MPKIAIHDKSGSDPIKSDADQIWFANEESYGTGEAVAKGWKDGGVIINPSNVVAIEISDN